MSLSLSKVRYATALDWFILMSFFYCIATLLEFAGVHYFTKVGSGEIPVDEDDWEDCETDEELVETPVKETQGNSVSPGRRARRRSSIICPIYNVRTPHVQHLQILCCILLPVANRWRCTFIFCCLCRILPCITPIEEPRFLRMLKARLQFV